MRIRDWVFPIKSNAPQMVPSNKGPLTVPRSAYDATHNFFASAAYTYVDTTQRQPTPGAEAFAFATQMLPLLDWTGPGELVQRSMQIQSRQLYVTQSVVPTGIPGIAAGQVFAGNLQAQDLSG